MTCFNQWNVKEMTPRVLGLHFKKPGGSYFHAFGAWLPGKKAQVNPQLNERLQGERASMPRGTRKQH